MEDRNEKIEGDVSIKTPFMTKLENFWYHYKWHTIAVIFIIVVIAVASTQMITKTSYDVHILYAGNHKIEKVSSDGNSTTPFTNTLKSFNRMIGDLDGDGEVNVNLLDLFIMTPEEIAEFNKNSDGTTQLNEIQIKENTDALEGSYLLFGDYYIFFISPTLFEKYNERYDGALFAPIKNYADEELLSSLELTENGCGVMLRSLAAHSLAGIEKLPDDTVVCIRNKSSFANSRENESHRRSEEAMREILSYTVK